MLDVLVKIFILWQVDFAHQLLVYTGTEPVRGIASRLRGLIDIGCSNCLNFSIVVSFRQKLVCRSTDALCRWIIFPLDA